jgi:hypothetical protein
LKIISKKKIYEKDKPRWYKVDNTDEFPYSTIGVVAFEDDQRR